jgi:uncharacterized protein (DUF1330 family)
MTSEVIDAVRRCGDDGGMTVYALAHLRNPTINDDVLEYIERIQDTMEPFGGRFLVHGADVEVVEGEWPGTVVIVEFPDAASAKAWYDSPGYRKILRLRTDHIDGSVILVEGVRPGYQAALTAAALRRRLS